MDTKPIYIVDDSADYRFLIQQVFTRFLAQYPLVLFDDGLTLVDHLAQLASTEPGPRLIVLDLDMPRMNGIHTLTWLGQQPRWQAVPVVMMSNRSDASFEAASYQRGAIDYVEKPAPLSIQALRNTFGRLCERTIPHY